MTETKTISLAGSEKLDWEDIENYARKNGFKTTSGFTQYLYEKEICGLRRKTKDTINYIMLLMTMIIAFLLFLLIISR
jgi:hypothetical protein